MLDLPAPGAFECLYVSSRAEVAVRSCAQRMAWERQQGLRVLVVALFGDTVGRLPDGVEGLACGLPEAATRHRDYASLRAQVEGRRPEDEDVLARAMALLDTLGRRCGARDVYAPLAVGQQVDDCLSHEAALRAFGAGSGRNLFLYEDAPQASVPGAVRVRLATIGAQLPPGAAAPKRAGVLRYVTGLLWTLPDRGGADALGERIALSRMFARQWRAARAWRPQRAFGPRLQPIEHAVAPTGGARFWLVLPERAGHGDAVSPVIAGPAPG
jgi:hypothetical protein